MGERQEESVAGEEVFDASAVAESFDEFGDELWWALVLHKGFDVDFLDEVVGIDPAFAVCGGHRDPGGVVDFLGSAGGVDGSGGRLESVDDVAVGVGFLVGDEEGFAVQEDSGVVPLAAGGYEDWCVGESSADDD